MKPRKLRSPVKAIHEALACVSLAVGNPLCVQPAKTESFRDLLASFNSVYYTPRVSSSSTSSNTCCHGSVSHHHQQFPVDVHGVPCGKEEEEEVVSISAATASTSTCSSCLSSSCVNAADNLDAAEDLPKGYINSRRFFFSPCASKFMAGESLLTVAGSTGGNPSPEPGKAEEAEEEDGALDVSPETTDVETVLEDMTTATGTSTLCKQSIPVALASMDPYRDFRNSMDEMVAAHGLRDWPGLQELLRCYLRLNDRKTHRLIVLAFTDLLLHLASQGKIHKSVVHGILSTSPSPSPHHYPC